MNAHRRLPKPWQYRLALTILGVAVLMLLTLAADRWVAHRVQEQLHDRQTPPPTSQVGLVLGTSKFVGAQLNGYYTARINAAAELYHRGLVSGILVSGDNSRPGYDEPTQMRSDLLELGVPEAAITRDYAGFRTLDSVVRAKQIFGARSVTIVSQRFHCERALYIARAHGLKASAYLAHDPPYALARIRVREAIARLAALVDVHLLHRKPRFLGPAEQLRLLASAAD